MIKKSWLSGSYLTSVLVVAVFSGLASGLLGGLLIRVYIYPDTTLSNNEINLSNLNANNPGLVIREPKNVVVNQDTKITETIASLRPSLVGVFKEVASSTKKDVNQSPNYYNLEHPLFIGLVMTADGWVMSMPLAATVKELKTGNYVAITNDRKVHKISEIAVREDLPGKPLTFRLVSTGNLPVKKIVPRSNLSLGQTLIALNNFYTVWPATLSSLVKGKGILNSETLVAQLEISAVGGDLSNSFIFDLAGNLVALVTSDATVVPAFSYNQVWGAATKPDKIQPSLGINYLDLSRAKVNNIEINKGALIYGSATQPAFTKNSLAQAAGLLAGDIITWINNQELSSGSDLTDLLSSYKSGDKIIISYLRSGLEKQLEIKL